MASKFWGVAVVAFMVSASRAEAIPQVGSQFPAFSASDVTGQQHHSRELVGHVSLVMVGTDSDVGDALRAWGSVADRRLPANAQRVIVMALDLAVIVPTALARSQARDGTPHHLWHLSWMDIGGTLRPTIGIPESEVPWIFVVDASGRVVANAHCAASDAGAAPIWRALETSAQALAASTAAAAAPAAPVVPSAPRAP
jgi:hypothetical protein